jgi:hypothetical protein
MSQPRGMNWVEAQVAMEKVWRCGCWDCAAHRRHVLRKAALAALAVGVTLAWASASGVGHGSIGEAMSAVSEAAALNWF